jgi:lipoprotein-anchoring transpeptidase ErfK/SrfK
VTRERSATLALALAPGLGLGLGLAACGSHGGGGAPHAAQTSRAIASAPAAPAAETFRLAPGESFVAAARGRSLAVFRTPVARSTFMRLANPDEFGAPRVLLVRRLRPGWAQVYLPTRPNFSSGWVPIDSVLLQRDSYRVVVRERLHLLTLWRANRLAMRVGIGVGSALTPTPAGRYYVTQVLQPPRGGPFGPYALGLSGHSNVLRSFGGGSGQLAIHGTNDPSSIGRDVSHGCIHLDNAAITRLALALPLGTPVQIIR